jgi:RHS repeat-associated protein
MNNVLGLFEKSAYAQTPPPPSSAGFAHHVHLTWALPQYPDYPTHVTTNPGLVGPYAFSPIWKAPPFAQLTTVDVFSATSTSTARQLVREYQLTYASNRTQTRSYLQSIQLVGDCDSVGGISETSISPGQVAACRVQEAIPPTTYTYYGISPVPPDKNGAPPPTILSETAAYSAADAVDFLADLNGDAVADLVTGNNGMAAVYACAAFLHNDPSGCWATDIPLAQATGGLLGQTCACQDRQPMIGPNSTSTFTATTANGLTQYSADDLMWPFSVFGDWTASGRVSFLEVIPDWFNLSLSANPIGYYTNPNFIPVNNVWLGGFSDVSSGSVSIQPQTSSVSVYDQLWLSYAVNATNSGASRHGISWREDSVAMEPGNAADLDGDGLPDMNALVNLSPNALSALFSTRDHNGATHPFQAQVTRPNYSLWEIPSLSIEMDFCNPAGPSLSCDRAAVMWAEGTFTQLSGGDSGQVTINDTPSHAIVDIDGDGLADNVVANKYRADWNATMLQWTNPFTQWSEYPDPVGWFDPTTQDIGAWDYVGLVVAPSRGDGRFGVGEANAGPAEIDDLVPFPDSGYYITPGATAPFAPIVNWTNINDVLGAGRSSTHPPYNTGPIPPPQSDALRLADGRYSYLMQQSAVRFGDLNGDGMADYAVLDGNGLHICLRYGGAWDSAHWRCVTDSTLVGFLQSDPRVPQATIQIGDITASGINRVMYFPPPNAPFGAPRGQATAIALSPDGSVSSDGALVSLSGGQIRDGLLETVSNGLGGQTNFTYATVHSLGNGEIPVPQWVVTSVTTTNGLVGTQAVAKQTQYTYGTPIYDARERTFVGFSQITATQSSDTTGSPGLWTTTTYATQTDQTCAAAGCGSPPEALIHFSRGLPLIVATGDNAEMGLGGSGRRFSTTYYNYALQQPYVGRDGRSGLGVSTTDIVTFPWNPGAASTSTSVTGPAWPVAGGAILPGATVAIPASGPILQTSHVFDINGNEVKTIDFGNIRQDTPILTERTWSLPPGDTTGWSYRVVQSAVGNALSYGGDFLGDPAQAQERVLVYSYDSNGRLVQVSAPLTGVLPLPGQPMLGGSFSAPRWGGQPPTAATNGTTVVLKTLGYDALGNVLTVGNQENPCLEQIQYDSQFDQLPALVTAHPDGNCGGVGLPTTIVMDRRLELVTSTVDAAQRMTTARYDDFGRVLEVDKPNALVPGMTTQALTAQYYDTGPIRTLATQTATGVDSGASVPAQTTTRYRYIDGLGETRAIVDQVDPASHGGQGWVLSGVHSSYLNGRPHQGFLPSFTSAPTLANMGVSAVLPPGITDGTLASPASTVVYDGLGRPTEVVDFNQFAAYVSYQDGSLSTIHTDPEQAAGGHQGASTTEIFDGHGRRSTLSANWPNGPSGVAQTYLVSTSYQPTGEVTTLQVTNDNTYRIGTRTYTYPSVDARTFKYDSLGHMVQNVSGDAGTWTYAYDNEGRLVGTADARGCGENLFYDLGGRPIAADYSTCANWQAYSAPSVAPGAFPYAGAEESYAYDPGTGFLVGAADRGRFDKYSYNAAGQLASITRTMATPRSSSAALNYGGPSYTESFNAYTYSGQVATRTAPGSLAPVETVSFDLGGAATGMGATIGSSAYTYLSNVNFDAVGRVVQATYGQAAPNGTGMGPVAASYGYDGNGNLTVFAMNRTYSGATSTSGYQLPPILDHTMTQNLVALTIGRDMVGNPTTISDQGMAGWPNLSSLGTQTYTYSDDYRLQTVTNSAEASLSSTNPDPGVNPFQYENSAQNPLYPLFTSPSTGKCARLLTFSYDTSGNVINSTDDANDFYFRSLGKTGVNLGTNQLAGADNGTGSLNVAYDGAGNVLSITETAAGESTAIAEYGYTWDEIGNLASATRNDGLGTVTETYTYLGHKRTSTALVVNGGTTPTDGYNVSIFDGFALKNATLAYFSSPAGWYGAYDDQPSVEHYYLGGGRAHVFQHDPRGQGMPVEPSGLPYRTFLSLPDMRGSGAFVIDQGTGELVEQTEYLPYGGFDSDWRSSRWSSPREDRKFLGQWDDSEVGLVYLNARYYSPQLGRFISPDPMTIHGLQGDPNPYEYGYGNPMAFADPSGLGPGDDFPDTPPMGPCGGPNCMGGAPTTNPPVGPSPSGSAGGSSPDPILQDDPRRVGRSRDLKLAPMSIGPNTTENELVLRPAGYGPAGGDTWEPRFEVSAAPKNIAIVPPSRPEPSPAQRREELLQQVLTDTTIGLATAGLGLGAEAGLAGDTLYGASVRPSATLLEDIGVCGRENCFNRALALDIRLGGGQASAIDGPAVTNREAFDVLEKIYPDGYTDGYKTKGEMERIFLSKGEGTRAIVMGDRGPEKMGHVFNAIVSQGRVIFLDAGRGGRASLAGYEGYDAFFTQIGGGF